MDDVETYISKESPAELGKAVVDMEMSVAVEEAYQLLTGYMTDMGVTDVNCVQTVAVAG